MEVLGPQAFRLYNPIKANTWDKQDTQSRYCLID
jgi:hypothetical protein